MRGRAIAEIVTLGDELNRGEIVDTNSSWLAERLTDLGGYVRWRSSVTDDPSDVATLLTAAAERADLIVCSGGLGPTDDDRTVDVVASLLGVETVTEPAHEERMRARFAERNFRFTPNNLRQVRIPAGAEVLANRHGLAPGFGVTLGSCRLYFMPGVPREMKPMFDEELVPRLTSFLGGALSARRRTWRVVGVGESHVDHALSGLLDGIPDATLHFRLAYPETLATVVVRRPSPVEAAAVLEQLDGAVRARLGKYCYGVDGDSLASALGRRLLEKSATLGLAESCTGGWIGQLVSAVPGCSAWFRGGIVSYDNSIKTGLLGVKAETLAANGAVSAEVALEMAAGARRLLGTTYALAVSGVAGPGGGTPDKPVGTVHVAAVGEGGFADARQLLWPGARDQVRLIAAYAALKLLYDRLGQ